ncbi:MAG: hypothetical protein ACE14L_03950 [Terriglobales bacterium]
MSEEKKTESSRFQKVGRRVDEEIEEFIRWFNNEAVPRMRQQSSRGLRTAATKLSELADYLDDLKRQK